MMGTGLASVGPQAQLDAGWDSGSWGVGVSLPETHPPCNCKSVPQSVSSTSFIPHLHQMAGCPWELRPLPNGRVHLGP